MASSRLCRPSQPMQWIDSWAAATASRAEEGGRREVCRGGDGGMTGSQSRRLADDKDLSPRSRPTSPTRASRKQLAREPQGVASWVETSHLDGDFSLDADRGGDGAQTCPDSMDVEAEEHDEPASRRRNSLGLALDLRDLKRSLILSCAKTNRLSATSSYPYPSPVSPAAALFARPSSASSAASSSAASEVDSYFACHRSRQLSDATTVSELDGGKDTFDLAGDDVDRDLPPSPELIPLDLPPFSQLPEPELPLDCPLPLPVEPVPTHPMHRSHRFAMTPVPATTARCKAGLDLPAPSEMPHAAVLPQDEQSCPDACSPEPPRLRKSSIVDLPPVSAQASPMTGALELGLEPLPPTPPRSPGAKVRMAPLPDMERGWPAVARPWVSSEPLPQSSKRQRRV